MPEPAHKKNIQYKKISRGDTMSENTVENHIESETERETGHVDTRHHTFECESPDAHLGCDPGIDVAG
jgi:hypothetical protein